MRRALLVPSLLLCFTTTSFADLVPVGPVPFSGTGLGTVNTILTVGNTPSESGCVGRDATGDVIGPAACPPGHPLIVGGDEKTGESQTLTRVIGPGTTEEPGLDLVNASQLRIVLNLNENEFDPVILEDLVLTIYSPAGAVLFTSGASFVPVIDLFGQGGTGTAGYVFQLDAAQAAQAQLVFDPTNRVGLAATLSDTTSGDETFFIADVAQTGAVLASADLSVAKTADAPNVVAGNTIDYSSVVTNLGPEAATNVIFTDVLPANTRFAGITAPAGWTCTQPAVGQGGTIRCSKATVAMNEMATFNYTTTVCAEAGCTTTVTNAASVNAASFDPATANNTSAATVTVQAQSDLSITKVAAPLNTAPGGSVIYTIDVSNAGPSNSIDNVITDVLPAGFVATNVTTTVGTCTGVGTGTVMCNIATLGAPGQCTTGFATTARITITAQAGTALGEFVNTATATSGNCLADANGANNQAVVGVTVGAAEIPTLSEYALLALALLLAGFGVMRLRM